MATAGGKQPTFCAAWAQRTVRPPTGGRKNNKQCSVTPRLCGSTCRAGPFKRRLSHQPPSITLQLPSVTLRPPAGTPNCCRPPLHRRRLTSTTVAHHPTAVGYHLPMRRPYAPSPRPTREKTEGPKRHPWNRHCAGADAQRAQRKHEPLPLHLWLPKLHPRASWPKCR